MTFNLTGVYNATDMGQLFTEVNSTFGGLIAVGILVIGFVVMYLSYRQFGTIGSLMVSGIVITVVAGLMAFYASWISVDIFLFVVGLTVLFMLIFASEGR